MNQLAMLNCNLHISDRARLSARDKRDEDKAHGNGTVKNGSYATARQHQQSDHLACVCSNATIRLFFVQRSNKTEFESLNFNAKSNQNAIVRFMVLFTFRMRDFLRNLFTRSLVAFSRFLCIFREVMLRAVTTPLNEMLLCELLVRRRVSRFEGSWWACFIYLTCT